MTWPRGSGLPNPPEQRDDLVRGKKYALRPKEADPADPFIKVTFVGPARGRQSKVRYEEGELAGLDEWVPTSLLACPWGERSALLRDEKRRARLTEPDNEIWDRVTEDAISTVMTASGEYGGYLRKWDTDPKSVQRYWDRAGLSGSPLDDHPANYEDRHGTWFLTFSTALKAARAFAAAEPTLVDLYIRHWEEELTAQGFEPGQSHQHDLLREWAPQHALARSWSQAPRGHAAEKEVERLRWLVRTAVRYLRESGADDHAARIERGMKGR